MMRRSMHMALKVSTFTSGMLHPLLPANPGQGKSRLAKTIYKVMRGNKNPYFKTSDSAVSFTKGVWRLSDEHKLKELSKDAIDILDVEGLQKENSVYYLLICVIVLSKTIVLLSRERVNKEALGVLEIAFKILDGLGIVLKRPVIFIQAKMNKKGRLLDGDGKPTTEDAIIDEIAKEIPVVKKFKVEFFCLTEIPRKDVLERAGLNHVMAQSVVENATGLYEEDVKKLLERLFAVKDPLPSEQRMHYLIMVLEHLNMKNPDLVLEQNLEFFERDAERWLATRVCLEREQLVQKHLNKPLGGATTLAEFSEPPEENLQDQFDNYCASESPFLGKSKDAHAFKQVADKVFNRSHYATGVLKAQDPNTGEVIGIMSYVQPSFEAKQKTDEAILLDVYTLLKAP
ncbi:expressed unknown protein [Seminavis robusta]|uniref:Uncharacterized protein n=1 Tax=Seminavis robusta TaxID=568900 RepID=A0A9N8EPU7_9STRA|nr:expressed unknown protein [Seminavis robusta]|eukprot:Sro1629_g287110.1 n/a (400) ;mRNA; f:12131-13330